MCWIWWLYDLIENLILLTLIILISWSSNSPWFLLPPGNPSRSYTIVFIFPSINAPSERILSQVVPLDGPSIVHGSVDVSVYNMARLIRRTGRSFGPLFRFPLGAGGPDLPDKFPYWLTWKNQHFSPCVRWYRDAKRLVLRLNVRVVISMDRTFIGVYGLGMAIYC